MKNNLFIILLAAMCLILLFACEQKDHDFAQASATITVAELSAGTRTLSSDEFEGRAPSSTGEKKTVAFLQEKLRELGVQPGNDTSYVQEVPLVAITASPAADLRVAAAGSAAEFEYAAGYIAWTKRVVGKASVRNSDLIFVGYGTVAPEYDWNDYHDIEVRGKTVVMLVNDPGYATQDDKLFKGNAMTYYGRWTYKFEEAARQGAEGAFVIHEDGPAGYPWEVVTGSWSGKQFDLVSEDNNMSRCAIEGWLSAESAGKLVAMTGFDLDSLKAAAQKPGFHAVALKLKASLSLENNIEHSRSKNVIAQIPGSTRADEYVFYTAHWDHFGKAEGESGDNIFNGAVDNATGTAGLLEIAGAFMSLKKRPARSIVFLAVTAEEQGLLGSRYYATHPVFPRNRTVAAINMDAMNVYGRMKDITIVGYGNSELDDYVTDAAARQGRTVRPDPSPEKGYFYRSDHFNFAKVGIPAVYTDTGIQHVQHGESWTMEQEERYRQNKYHKPADEYDDSWDLTGLIDDLRLLFDVGYQLSNSEGFPNWRDGNEFRALRDEDMSAAAMQSSK